MIWTQVFSSTFYVLFLEVKKINFFPHVYDTLKCFPPHYHFHIFLYFLWSLQKQWIEVSLYYGNLSFLNKHVKDSKNWLLVLKNSARRVPMALGFNGKLFWA
jgi:hypothetical protein